ncbi:SMI1/KNR4 family protein [Bacillus suaedae]|uniref:SMI1/KNR4 family protein n=1 Tax=Halalkalibacter suaedae TaxID=2822140 RepID=A0A940WY16_9BACI|nr:SMI1/KNR4 family protein [Bacillus suaedae]MBP3950481.1 SMI1/KNR4 family protein [Bacillus suaedae]
MIEMYEGNDFWASPSEYKPGEQLTIEKRITLERNLGVKFPDEFIQLMEMQNGGQLSYRYVLFEDGDAAIIPFFYEMEEDSGIGLSQVFVEECGLPEGIILLTGDFHTWVALDYREDKQVPAVVYIVQSEMDENKWEEFQMASTFNEFLGKLFKK